MTERIEILVCDRCKATVGVRMLSKHPEDGIHICVRCMVDVLHEASPTANPGASQ